MDTDHRFYAMQDRDSTRLLAPSLRQAAAEEPEVLALDAAVARLELAALEAQYARVGHPAYPPAVMLKVLLYGYSLGLRSSRQLERACKRDDAFRFLAGGLRPDHNSLCRFRRRHARELPELFAQTVGLCQEAGLVRLGEVALDGTKVRANRAKGTLRASQRLRQALTEAEAADEGEEEDEECAFLRTGEGIQPAYNAQLAVAGEHQVILACHVDTAPNDSGHLAPLVAQVKATCGEAPGRVLADGSYANNAGIAEVEGQGVAVYVPVREPGQAHLEWVAEEGAYRCLAGRWLRFGGWSRGRLLYQYSGCRGCPQARACGVSARSKRVYVWPEESPVGRVRARLATVAGAAIYARRKVMIEPVFGKLKHNWGFRRLLLRGRRGACIEWTLLCVAHNLRKWGQATRLLPRPPRLPRWEPRIPRGWRSSSGRALAWRSRPLTDTGY